jgi:hypothetical protein
VQTGEIAKRCLVPTRSWILSLSEFLIFGLAVVRLESGRLALVYRLLDPFGFAAGQLVVFQGASEAPISELIRVERATQKKQPTGRGPEGCVENGPAAALLVGYVSI